MQSEISYTITISSCNSTSYQKKEFRSYAITSVV